MKKLLITMLALAMVISCVFAVTASAEDIIVDNTYTAVCGEDSAWVWDADALTLTYNNGTATVIEETDDGEGNTVETEVEAVDSWTFTFTLKNTDLTMTGYADNCTSTLDDIIIPSFVQVDDETTYAVKSITGGPRGVVTIQSVVIYDGPTTISGSVFENCTGLVSITIPESVTSIGSYCFKQCSALETLNLNAKVTELGRDTFYKCTSLTGVVLPDTIKTLGQGVFSSCSALTEINFPASLTSIGNTCFTGSGLTEVTVPSTVTTINTYAFSKCTSLTKATINSAGLTKVPDGIFQSCTALSEIVLPDTITEVGANAFDGTIIDDFDFTDITSIGNYAFQYTKLTTVTIPAGTVSIGTGAFRRCKSLTHMYINSEGLTKIPDYMFYESDKLQLVEYPDTVTELGTYAFYKAAAVEVDLSNITTIGDGCFQWTSHKYYVIPECVTSIGKLAFQNNSLSYIIFEGKTAPTFGGTAGNPRSYGQGLRSDAKGTGTVYVPANSTGYEEAYADFFTTEKMTLNYFGARISDAAAEGLDYTVGYTYNDLANIQDSTNVDYQNDKIMVALYDGEGVLVGAKTASATEVSAVITANAAAATAKIFALDNITSLKPLYEAHTYTIQ